MEFKKVKLEDKTILDSYYKENSFRNCELTFANTFLWSQFYLVEYTIIDQCLVYKTVSERPQFIYPIGAGDKRTVIVKLMDYCKEINVPFSLRLVNQEMYQELEDMFPDTFQIEYDRDAADYLYLSEKLMTLSGKKYHGKKNHINKFRSLYEWSYERINDTNKHECIQMAEEWNALHQQEDEGRSSELKITLDAIKYFDELELSGGLIRVDQKVVAFSIGEQVGKDTFVIHIEKAFADIQGAYPVINQQMVIDFGKDYTYINREEDMGVEGLRKAKLSYKPIMILEKGIVTMK
ncbi:DUF2156 domain-containing protein [Anaeromicropila herbilytica]|uniref:Phosphatidylglycerol lysyltransferase C-terminal domain-containing protein n=1 Tax=Anaeromicropila herbilytica TaxID=2785025 RepID=A0A7R7EKD0_9FIRM|nr:hypothetical protein bsdtb5_16240 [Anaeromicropila herbilytica]